MTKSERETQKAEAIKQLREYLPAGSMVYTILREVSRSGMSRKISVMAFDKGDNGEIYPLHLSILVGRALGWRVKTGFNDTLLVSGCGMDMGLHLVTSLAYTLYGKSDALKQRWI